MSEAVVDDLVAILPPLLQSLDTLGFVTRHLNPPDFALVMETAGTPDEALRSVRAKLSAWPEEFAHVRRPLEAACDATLGAYDGLRTVQRGEGDMMAVFRALRYFPRAQEAIYPLTATLPPVSRFFLDPATREDESLLERLAAAPGEDTGIFHQQNDRGMRGGFSLYVPEYYTADRAWPLVVALHGGAGHGRQFLWTWLRDARSHGAIVVAPTASGDTWALTGDAIDTENLSRIVDTVRSRWNVDPNRLLLTGISDGGTFCYVTGLQDGSPFTHLAPVAATFHPMIAEIADPARLRQLPIYLVHGALDWMFPVEIARQARKALTRAGAHVTYREIEDLSHSYPSEINPQLLHWLNGTSA